MKEKKINESSSKWIESAWKVHANQIYKLCLSKCSSKEEAKDLFQTVALKFCQNAKKLQSREKIFPWFVCVIKNSLCDMVYEKHSTYSMSSLGDKVESYYALPEEKSVFFQGKSENYVNYEVLFSILSPLERMIVELTYIGGFSSTEISPIIGLSANAIRKRRHFAVIKIRNTFFKEK